MKTFAIALALAGLAWFRAAAQVNLDVSLDQTEFLPSESLPVAVKITNLSGQQLHLGRDNNWLTFSVESYEGSVVYKNFEVPVEGPFDLESSQRATKYVDIAPSFVLSRPGRYKVTATLHLKDWGTSVSSPARDFDVVTGVKIWSQDFGLPSAGGVPQMRRFALEKANYLREQLRLYVQLSDVNESRIFKVFALGPMVSFGYPEEQVDRTSQLHVLWQTGGQTFNYCIVSPQGELLSRDTYDMFGSRPKLQLDDNGDVAVVGGVKRVPESDIPQVQSPLTLPPAPSK